MTTLEHMARAVNMVRDSLEKGVPTMTTTIPTFYDDQIAAAEQVYSKEPTERTFHVLTNLRNKAEGYRRAKAEDAALLEAAVAVRDWLLANKDVPDDGTFHDYPKFEQPIAVLNTAIAQATGKEEAP